MPLRLPINRRFQRLAPSETDEPWEALLIGFFRLITHVAMLWTIYTLFDLTFIGIRAHNLPALLGGIGGIIWWYFFLTEPILKDE
jgi:hypothetical protein